MKKTIENSLILLVEDSPEDYETTVRAFRKSGLKNGIVHCQDGDEAIDYLFHRGKFADAGKHHLPGIILLDLNLPGTDGREVLKEIKKNETLKKIPVVVLTTSSDERDIEQCYADGANSYIQKPVDLSGFFDAVKRLKEYWFEISIIPKI
ncbi:MAG: response regulator [Planctomycetes bacterium]|nr:response regulator [Planctomycetota bacterium]